MAYIVLTQNIHFQVELYSKRPATTADINRQSVDQLTFLGFLDGTLISEKKILVCLVTASIMNK